MPNTPPTSPKSSNEVSVTPSNEESVTPSNEESGSDSQQTFMNSLSDEECLLLYLLKLDEVGLSEEALDTNKVNNVSDM